MHNIAASNKSGIKAASYPQLLNQPAAGSTRLPAPNNPPAAAVNPSQLPVPPDPAKTAAKPEHDSPALSKAAFQAVADHGAHAGIGEGDRWDDGEVSVAAGGDLLV